jgi:hypothetical protein
MRGDESVARGCEEMRASRGGARRRLGERASPGASPRSIMMVAMERRHGASDVQHGRRSRRRTARRAARPPRRQPPLQGAVEGRPPRRRRAEEQGGTEGAHNRDHGVAPTLDRPAARLPGLCPRDQSLAQGSLVSGQGAEAGAEPEACPHRLRARPYRAASASSSRTRRFDFLHIMDKADEVAVLPSPGS